MSGGENLITRDTKDGFIDIHPSVIGTKLEAGNETVNSTQDRRSDTDKHLPDKVETEEHITRGYN